MLKELRLFYNHQHWSHSSTTFFSLSLFTFYSPRSLPNSWELLYRRNARPNQTLTQCRGLFLHLKFILNTFSNRGTWRLSCVSFCFHQTVLKYFLCPCIPTEHFDLDLIASSDFRANFLWPRFSSKFSSPDSFHSSLFSPQASQLSLFLISIWVCWHWIILGRQVLTTRPRLLGLKNAR